MKVVFDTNILVSALVFPGGRGEAALRRIIEEIVTGDHALLELREYDGVRIISLRDYLERAASAASD